MKSSLCQFFLFMRYYQSYLFTVGGKRLFIIQKEYLILSNKYFLIKYLERGDAFVEGIIFYLFIFNK